MDTLRELEGEARAPSLGPCVQDGWLRAAPSLPQPHPAPAQPLPGEGGACRAPTGLGENLSGFSPLRHPAQSLPPLKSEEGCRIAPRVGSG